MSSNNTNQLIARGQALQNAGQLIESIQCYSAAIQIEPTWQAYWLLITAQLASQQNQQAHNSCESAIALYPRKLVFHRAIAKIGISLGNLEGAIESLQRATELFPDDIDIATEYARLLMQTRRFVEAVPAFARIVALNPSAKAYRNLSKMQWRAGDDDGAHATLLEGREKFPLDGELAGDCAGFAPEATALSHEAMRAALPTMDSRTRSQTLSYLTTTQVHANRQHRPLRQTAASDWTDLVRWSDPEGLTMLIASLEEELAGPNPRPDAAIERGCAAVGQMDWEGAERWFAKTRVSPAQSVTDVATFDPEFYQRLEEATDEEIWSPFSPIWEVIPRTTWPAVMVYVPCDPKYFKIFFERFASALVEKIEDVGIHVHMLDGSPEEWNRLARMFNGAGQFDISMTAEAGARQQYGNNARDYYVTARFVRFHNYFVQNKRPMWLIDIDTDTAGDPRPLFNCLDGHDIAVTSTATNSVPWNKVHGGLVGVNPTHAGLRFSRLVAANIAYWFKQGGLRWIIDQQALFGTLFYLEQQGCPPRTRFLDDSAMTTRDDLPAVFKPIVDVMRYEKLS